MTRRHTVSESGQVAALWAVLATAIFALGGLVHDGGQVLTARRQADNLARQAARAGAQALDEAALRAGAPLLDPTAAEAAARSYLTRRGVAATSIEVGSDHVSVAVVLTQPTPLLAILGIDARTVRATATARSGRGVAEVVP